MKRTCTGRWTSTSSRRNYGKICGEFEAAEMHSLPKLIEQENLRGTFHCHTSASDGHNSLEEMAEAAQALGLEYLGIADHSRSSIQAHGIDEAQLRVQVAAIRELNKKLDGFRMFAGVECDILRDGSLDFPDEVLAELDYVIVSVHSVFNLSEADMTRRDHSRDGESGSSPCWRIRRGACF